MIASYSRSFVSIRGWFLCLVAAPPRYVSAICGFYIRGKNLLLLQPHSARLRALQRFSFEDKFVVEEIKDNDQILGLIIRANFDRKGVHFFTPDRFSQQLAYMHHPAGKTIAAHCHSAQPRNVEFTQEVLIIRKGALRVDFYRTDKSYLESRILRRGDVILLAHGGHGFEVLEEIEMIEVKQGPYRGEGEKTPFPGIAPDQIKII